MRNLLTIVSLLAASALYGVYDAGSGARTALDAGASKQEVRAALGAPTLSRGVVRNDHDQVVEVWEYWSGASADEAFWYYFIGDELVQRSSAGDWAAEPGRIKDTRFGPVA